MLKGPYVMLSSGDVKENDIMFSDLGTHFRFTRTSDQYPCAVKVNLPINNNDTKDIYYEATMTQCNNSIAVGISPIDTITSLLRVPFHGSERSAIRGGIGSGLQQNWTFFVLRSWPYDAAYTYHGDTGKV